MLIDPGKDLNQQRIADLVQAAINLYKKGIVKL